MFIGLKLYLVYVVFFNTHVWAEKKDFYILPDKSTGEIQSQKDRAVLYKYTRIVTNSGELRTVKRTYESPEGQVAAAETFTFKDGKVQKMVWEQFQVNETGQFEVKDGKVHFSHTQNGKTKTNEEELKDNFVSQEEIVTNMYKHWDKLMKGETIYIRLPVVFRTETIGFKFFKESETDEGIKIKMKPSSFIIAAAVKPLIFLLKKDGDNRLLYVNGRVTPKIQEAGKWKDLDAFFVIHYN